MRITRPAPIFAAAFAAVLLSFPDQSFAQADEPSHGRPMTSTLNALTRSASLLEPPASPVPQGQGRPRRQIVWAGIGAGLGFGAGMLTGLTLFDDAVHAERKMWMTSAAGAAAGAAIGALLSRDDDTQAAGPTRHRRRAGMIAGAAIGAAIGMVAIPVTQCDTRTNPECPVTLGIVIGVPSVAAGAAVGALIDRLR